jgi:putative CocE/NonD family hydrolase
MPTNMQIDYNARARMRDGSMLSAIVCLPQGQGPFPSVLGRSCYTKWAAPLAERSRFWTSAGYAYVLQDVRGRGDSDGVFYPLINEQADGVDTLDWIIAQPWSDGRVVMIGGSYGGWTQLFVASTNHPALRALSPSATPPDPDRSFPVHHGIPVPSAAAWLATLDGRTNQDLATCDVPGAFATLPIIDFDRHIGRHLVAWRDWIGNAPGSPYWLQQRYQEALLESRIPMLHVSGWYDDCLVGTLENFAAMSSSARECATRTTQRMIIGPWLHGASGQRRVGDLDFGAEAEMQLADVQRRWFDGCLAGEVDASPPVRLFVMGRNAWLHEHEWPLARTSYVPYYLHSGGRANSRNGDGSLSPLPPVDEPHDGFSYDPANPVPYCADFDWRQVGGPDDCAGLELRSDILVYTSAPIVEPLLVCGPLRVRLFAASSARDTDWTAKVLDVHPDGRAIRLNDGVVRARFRNGTGVERFLSPGVVEEYLIDCWATCIELQPGHCLRLEISSSAFGKGDLNLNGGGPIGRETMAVVARQSVYHDRARASHLLLPVVQG